MAAYESDLARRRFDTVDPANRLVFDTLAHELEVSLQAVAEGESALEQFDNDDPPRPTVEERARLLELGNRLEDVWYSPHVDSRLKQQVVRLLIEYATVDINDSGDEVVLWLKWSTGHHTELRSARRRRRLGRSRDKIRSLFETLRKIADDLTISRTLNRVGVLTPENKSWTQQRVSQFRKRERIAAFSETTKKREGWLTQGGDRYLFVDQPNERKSANSARNHFGGRRAAIPSSDSPNKSGK